MSQTRQSVTQQPATNVNASEQAISLQQLQSVFKNYLMNNDTAIAPHIVSSESLGNDLRLAIYANAYVARLIEVLENDFTALQAVLEEDEFYDLAQAYIQQHPSTTPSLRWFGRYMAEFLSQHEQYQQRQDLIELAVFEWSFVDAFDAADVPVITLQDMAQVPPESWPVLCFTFHPSVQTFDYQWNIIPVWQAIQQQEDIPAPQQLPQPQTCIIWRDNLKTRYRTLEDDEAAVLSCAREGSSFAQICESLIDYVEDESQIALRAASLLKGWIEVGMVRDLNY